MSWKGVTIMDQRIRFISEYLNGFFPVSELCSQFEISRKTGYKWIKRYKEYGPKGLLDQSRKPLTCPHQTEPEAVYAIVGLRNKHPSWGAKEAFTRYFRPTT